MTNCSQCKPSFLTTKGQRRLMEREGVAIDDLVDRYLKRYVANYVWDGMPDDMPEGYVEDRLFWISIHTPVKGVTVSFNNMRYI